MSLQGPKHNDQLTTYLVAQLLPPEAQQQYSTGKIGRGYLDPYVKSIRKISERYTEHFVGAELSASVLTEQEAIAYALYYLPINFSKIESLLKQCDALPKDYSILDYGCGPGTAALASIFHSRPPKSVTCLDHSAHMRSVARRLLQPQLKISDGFSATVLSHTQELPAQSRYDLIIAANVLAELNDDVGQEALSDLISRLTPKGYLLLLEPGQPAHTRRLMTIRNDICKSYKDLIPLFPCCRSDSCPMLTSSESDWCHGTLEWQRPRLIQQLDEELEFNKHRVKYSAFIFQRSGELRAGYRVIEPGRRNKRGIEATLCGRDFFGQVVLKPETRNAENRPLERSATFERLELSVPAKAVLKPNTRIVKVEPF